MTFKTLQPEFAYMNYGDNAVYGSQATVTITSNFDDESKLYDNESDEQADIASPSYPEVIEFDFGTLRTVSLIKLLNTNFKSFKIEVYDGSVWSTYVGDDGVQADFSNYSKSYYSSYKTPGEGYLLVTDAGDFLETTSGKLLVSSTRYSKARITVNSTQDSSTPKLGEFYVGARAMRLTIGKALDFEEMAIDFRKNTMSSYQGKAFTTRSLTTYGANIRFRVTDFEEYRFLEDLTKLGGLYTFFPTGTEYGLDISPSFDTSDIILVQSDSDWRARPWGVSAQQQINIKILESAYVPSA